MSSFGTTPARRCFESTIRYILCPRRKVYNTLHRLTKSSKLKQRQSYVRDKEHILKSTAVRTVKAVGRSVTKQPESLKFDDTDAYDMPRERYHSIAIVTRYSTVVVLLGSNHPVNVTS